MQKLTEAENSGKHDEVFETTSIPISTAVIILSVWAMEDRERQFSGQPPVGKLFIFWNSF